MKGIAITAAIQGDPAHTPVVFAEVHDPEVTVANALRDFLGKLGFSSLFPNFGSVRVTTVHPFAMFLFQQELGKPIDESLLPSVTVQSSSDTEVVQMLAHEKTPIEITTSALTQLLAAVSAGSLFCSVEGIERLNTAIGGDVLLGEQKSIQSDHQLNLNIWTDNKEMTGILYDIVRLFALNETDHLRDNGIDIIGQISGTRSGDINIEFGRLLFGANVVIPSRLKTSALEIKLHDIGRETDVEINPIYS